MVFTGIFSFCMAVFCTWVGVLMYHGGNYFLSVFNIFLGILNLAGVMKMMFSQ